MSITHLHLLLNHVPMVGIVGVALLFALALRRHSDELTRVALGFTVALALVAGAVFLTGEPAEELIEHLPGFDDALVERHEDVALVATVAFGALGALAAGALLWARRHALPRRTAMLGLAGALAVGALVGWTANLGGMIRHSELRTASAVVESTESRER